jgi:hypothetical protein
MSGSPTKDGNSAMGEQSAMGASPTMGGSSPMDGSSGMGGSSAMCGSSAIGELEERLRNAEERSHDAKQWEQEWEEKQGKESKTYWIPSRKSIRPDSESDNTTKVPSNVDE